MILIGLAASIACAIIADDSLNIRPAGMPVIELQSRSYIFDTSLASNSRLTAQTPDGIFSANPAVSKTFSVIFTVTLKKFEQTQYILKIPNILNVCLRQHDPLDRNRQNYPAFKRLDGSVPVLEATVELHSLEHPDWKSMTIGIPLAMLDRPEGQHEVMLNFSDADWKMYVDGEMLDNDFPFGYPQWASTNIWNINPDYVQKAEIYIPGIKPKKKPSNKSNKSYGIQYWTPQGHNNWVGDVESFYYQGRYHVFYLYDRRHHQSKFGCGAHYFEHLSTTDFKTWTEHEAATPLENQWECIGTGVPFLFNNRLCLSYGLHTTRVYPEEKTALPAQWEYLRKNGYTGSFMSSATVGVPAGSTYAVSQDGVTNFRKSNIMFHPCQNPSVYTDFKGRLRLLANYGSKGIWESESVYGGWKCINSEFPPGGDCTIYFHWNKFDYIIGGFTDLWVKPSDKPDSAYEDMVRKGLDFYDGSNVPSITEINDKRFLMASWIPIRGWGGTLVIRELLQFQNGRIGSKWMDEIIPQTDTPSKLASSIDGTDSFAVTNKSFMLTLNVVPSQPKHGRFCITFLDENGDQNACEVQIQLDTMRAQFASGSTVSFSNPQKTLREGGAPHGANNYAIENLIDVEKPFLVRAIAKSENKIGGTVIDVEIAGKRTMISYRQNLSVKRLLFRTEGIELKNVQLLHLIDRNF